MGDRDGQSKEGEEIRILLKMQKLKAVIFNVRLRAIFALEPTVAE